MHAEGSEEDREGYRRGIVEKKRVMKKGDDFNLFKYR